MLKEKYTIKDFLPLIVIFAIILGVASLITLIVDGNFFFWMRMFMGVFFIIFGALKVRKLKDFASAYKEYDLIAKRSDLYAHMYPFIELALGIFFLIGVAIMATNIITLIIMIISALGVYLKLRTGEKIMCACLGTVFKVPMTWVTLFEDLLMALMAGVMIFYMT